MIFDETTLRKITRLTLVSRQVRAGLMKGERRSVRRGSSLEFADYRNYTPGDDLRRLDWNVYARLDRPFLKLFEEEEDLAVHVLLDGSRSMDWGEGEQNKFGYGLKLAGAIGAMALAGGDRLSVTILRIGNNDAGRNAPGALDLKYGPARGEANTLAALRFLEGAHPAGRTDLVRSLKDYLSSGQRPGLLFLISDFFSTGGIQDQLNGLVGRGYEVALIHLLAPEEIEPPLAGDLRLVDVETEEGQEVSVDGAMRALYRQRLEAWRQEIRAACQQKGVRYLGLSTSQPWEEVILEELRLSGVAR
ncbi:MAG TPA: DUF58 domain-containing protein [Anaerolineaceae bacterium]|nr:DUF58 domain-containing protein [Anaerolineaceae bacterium]